MDKGLAFYGALIIPIPDVGGILEGFERRVPGEGVRPQAQEFN